MARRKAAVLLKLGDRVQVRHHPRMWGKIVELRGPLGPGGAEVYRVRFPRKPKSMYIELRGDQLIPIAEPVSTPDETVLRHPPPSG